MDGAYDTRKCREAIAARSAAAVIPPRKNVKPWKPTSPGAVARNEVLRASRCLDRSGDDGVVVAAGAVSRPTLSHVQAYVAGQWMNCIKLLDQSFMARDFDRQVAELQVRIAVLNGYAGPATPVTVAVE